MVVPDGFRRLLRGEFLRPTTLDDINGSPGTDA